MQPHVAGPTLAGALSVAPLLLPLLLLLAAGRGAATAAELDAYAGTGCMFEGARYRPGQAVPVKDEPCLRCRCRRGAPVCRLRVCAPLPDPPPPGCVLLHRANACCPELHCPELGVVDNRLEARHGTHAAHHTRYRSDAPNKGCYLNGSLFAEGSALSSSTLCDYCYCVRGQQRCVRPQCVLPAPGCTPEYRDHTCCPTSYHCGGSSSNSTSEPPRRRASGCTVDGRRYRDGAQVRSVARGQCETCFCMRGRVRCAPLKCDLPLDGCEPVTEPGRCCPVSYDCSKSRVSITKTVTATSGHKTKGSIGRPGNGENSVRSISFDARSNREISSKDTGKVKNEMERSEQNVVLTTQPPLPDESPTTLMTGIADNIAITLNTKLDLGDTLNLLKINNNTVFPEKNKILPVIEAIINKTRQKDQDYDYDYNEPSLPPSLPNLRIIPFVAADAVVQDEKTRTDGGQILPQSTKVVPSKEPQDKVDNFYFFSPPTETEGGFVPREPIIDGPFYQHKPDSTKKEVEHKVAPVKVQPPEVTIRTVVPEAVTPDPLLGNGGSAACTSGGRRYRHGELLTGMGACRMCFCFDGGIVCQEPSCGAVPPGCSRAPSRDPERCCGSITCEGDENRDRPLLFADAQENEPHREHSKIPERLPVIEPVSDLDLEPGLAVPPARRPPPPKTTTTTTTSAPSTTTAKGQRRKTTTTTSTTTSTPATKSTAKPALKTKTTTTKPVWTTKKPTTSTTKTTGPSTTKAAAATSTTTTTAAPAVTRPTTPTTTTPKATPTTPRATTAATKATTSTPRPTTTTIKVTTTTKAAPSPTTHKAALPMENTASTLTPSSSTPRTVVTTAPTTSTTTTTRTPVRKERPTTPPTSLFDALWGSEDDSENEAQDKVDQDVEYHDFVSTNEHEPAPPPPKPAEEAEEDSFSFDKFLELFIQPDPTTTTTAPPPPQRTTAPPQPTTRPASTTRTPATSKPPSSTKPPTTTSTTTTTKPSAATTSKTSTTASTTTSPKSTAAPQTTAKPSTAASTAKPTATAKPPTAPAARVNVSSTTPASQRTTAAQAKPTPTRTSTPRTTPAATKKSPTTPKPRPSPAAKPATTAKPSTAKPAVTKAPPTTARPASTTSATTTTTKAAAPTTAKATPTTTTTTTTTTAKPSTTTTPLPIATVRPSLLFGSTKFRPSFLQDALAALSGGGSGSSSSYPAQQHHMSTRRPVATTTTAAPAGLSGLLKLAGCNIYGRMYRVGKIIQELSGPCLECRCTEVGVQCQQLSC